ncbi:MAG: DUF4160 domain-containing protein [Treponemataceae bacterium]|uniref:DUF4160 domain-containing protein n=1 Tax=Treponema sp. J25 TaxID=2094121 RepID=UPI001A9F4572|nr:DUF4160 domain-containing protein [Treponema sp. J25]MCX7950164.1 DUF4160 domain-containing protein [Treponemataceae bacterium]
MRKMPLISEFYGIKIYMYWNDHVPPHFHAEYNGFHIMVHILEGSVLKGVFPLKQLQLVEKWVTLHRGELLNNWNRAKENREILHILPLE